jgi:UbiD family decarboxylase
MPRSFSKDLCTRGSPRAEGPFGEFSGYMSPGGQSPVIEITCVTRRRNPVYHAF